MGSSGLRWRGRKQKMADIEKNIQAEAQKAKRIWIMISERCKQEEADVAATHLRAMGAA